MALAKKCDRCGILYESYPKGSKIQYNAIRRVFAHPNDYIQSQGDKIDLCPSCMKMFNEFMISGGKFDDQN